MSQTNKRPRNEGIIQAWHSDMIRGIGEAAVADGAGCLRHQVHDILGAMHVAGPELVVASLPEDGVLEVDVGAGVVLPTHAHDLVAAAPWHGDAKLAPGLDISLFAVDAGELLERELLDGVVPVEEHCDGVVADDMLHWLDALAVREFFFLVFDPQLGSGKF